MYCLFAVAKGRLLLDIGWFVLFSPRGNRKIFTLKINYNIHLYDPLAHKSFTARYKMYYNLTSTLKLKEKRNDSVISNDTLVGLKTMSMQQQHGVLTMMGFLA